MMDDITLLGCVCLALALWVIRLQRKLSRAEEFAFMSMLALRDVADGKVQINRDEEGTITIKSKKEKP